MTTISTTARPAYVYDETEDTWYPVGAQAVAFVTNYIYTATASQTVFSGADDNSQTLSYTTGAVKVVLNGALLTPDIDYSALNGTSVTLGSGAAVNDILVIVAADTYQAADTYTQAQSYLLFVSKDGGSIITETGSANALTITNTGTGNSFVVEDSTSPDATPFVVNAAGNVGVGITTPTNYKLEVAGIVEADNYDIGLTTLASDSIALNFSGETGLYTRAAAGNITFTASNYRVGAIKTIRVIPGASLRTLTFLATWVFVGIKPANVAANKTGILTITSFGTSEGDCVAAWAVQS